MKIFKLMAVAATFAIGFVACEKSEETKSVVAQNETVEQKIIKFNDLLNSENRSSEMFQISDGIWNLESAISLFKTRAGLRYNNSSREKREYAIQVSNSQVSLDEIKRVYNLIIADMQSIWNGTNGTFKAFNVVNIEFLASENKINVSYVFSYGEELANENTIERDINRDYFWGVASTTTFKYGEYQPNGNCPNQYANDAANAIQGKLYYYFINPYMSPAGTYVTDIDYVTVSSGDFNNPNDATPSDNMFDYLMFHNDSDLPNYHMCLSKSEINTYVDLTWSAISKTVENGGFRPANKVISDVDMWGDLLPLQYSTVLDHFATVTYGEKHVTNLPFEPGF